jgi:hypothetical protein
MEMRLAFRYSRMNTEPMEPLKKATSSLGRLTYRRNVPMVPYRRTAMMYFQRSTAVFMLSPP